MTTKPEKTEGMPPVGSETRNFYWSFFFSSNISEPSPCLFSATNGGEESGINLEVIVAEIKLEMCILEYSSNGNLIISWNTVGGGHLGSKVTSSVCRMRSLAGVGARVEEGIGGGGGGGWGGWGGDSHALGVEQVTRATKAAQRQNGLITERDGIPDLHRRLWTGRALFSSTHASVRLKTVVFVCLFVCFLTENKIDFGRFLNKLFFFNREQNWLWTFSVQTSKNAPTEAQKFKPQPRLEPTL